MKIPSFLYRINRMFQTRGLVLMYHRVATPVHDPWDLAVSPDNFKEQLEVLQAYNVIATADLESVITGRKKLQPRSVVLTFDDGYIDNFSTAAPLLNTFNLPATFFINTGAIGSTIEFWPDALERICFQTPQLPHELTLHLPHERHWLINTANQNGNAGVTPTQLYYQLSDEIRLHPASKQQEIVRQLEAWSGNGLNRKAYLRMAVNELQILASNPLFTIGAHTVTHPFLPNFPPEYQLQDIQGSIIFLKDNIYPNISYLAYPHGGYNAQTLAIMEQLKMGLAFTTHEDSFHKGNYRFTVPRFHVKNWGGDTFEKKLRGWLNY